MAQSTSVNGATTKQMVMGNSFTQMEISTKGSGWTIRHTGKANMSIPTAPFMRAAGSMTNSQAME